MCRTLVLAVLVVISVYAQDKVCNPNTSTGPCDAATMTCPDGTSVCDTAGTECCAAADLVDVPTTTTVTVPTTTSTGATTTTTARCVDLLNPSNGISDCPQRAHLCNQDVYYAVMTEQCPKTCGRCSSTSTTVSANCVDLKNPSTGFSDCPSRKHLCSNSLYYDVMRVQCPRTCSLCGSNTTTTPTTTTCADLTGANGVSDCSSRAYLCKNSAYRTLMTEQCPKTCGFCT